MLLPIHLKNTHIPLPINLLPGGATTGTLTPMFPQRLLMFHILETKLTNEEDIFLRVLLGIRRKIPRLHFPTPHQNLRNVLNLGNLLVLFFESGELVHRLGRRARGRGVMVRVSAAAATAAVVVVSVGGGGAVHRRFAAFFTAGGTAGGRAGCGGGCRGGFLGAFEGGKVEFVEFNPFVQSSIVIQVVDVVINLVSLQTRKNITRIFLILR
mmetsp:Transcript_19898/g.24564  ORF Transcript_19898/g.24564 Transcript_19898/m.24564 type:complete len:211 (-) Transcript_19898:415-1047(-)